MIYADVSKMAILSSVGKNNQLTSVSFCQADAALLFAEPGKFPSVAVSETAYSARL
jgi:hypothetical protein